MELVGFIQDWISLINKFKLVIIYYSMELVGFIQDWLSLGILYNDYSLYVVCSCHRPKFPESKIIDRWTMMSDVMVKVMIVYILANCSLFLL